MQTKPRFRVRHRNLWIVAISSVLLWAISARAKIVAALQNVIIEPKTILLPGGAGKKPFDVTRHIIPLSKIDFGGPRRDDIPAIFRPEFIEADRAGDSLKGADRVLGVFLKGEAKAYPVPILNYHELVNDKVGGRPILVCW